MSPDVVITYLGHCTLLLEIGGLRFLTDPMLRMRIPLLRRHGPLPDVDLVDCLDAVLISHLHLDHANPASLRLLPHDCPVVAPAGARGILRRYRLNDVREVSPGDSLRFGDVSITATPARHGGRRYPWGRQAGAVGYVIKNSLEIYFAGDTGTFAGLADLSGSLDVALLPIWGGGSTLPDDHLSPEAAARALEVLRPRLAIPIHWGTFLPAGIWRFVPHFLTNPPREFALKAGEYAPGVRTVILEPGESITLPGNEGEGSAEGTA